MKEKHEPNTLDRAFDYLSKIPWLKKLMKIMWITSTIYLGIAIILECIAVFIKKIPFRPELIKNITLYVTINSFFAVMFFLWGKRESSSEMKKNK